MDYICFMTSIKGYSYCYYAGLQCRGRFVMA